MPSAAYQREWRARNKPVQSPTVPLQAPRTGCCDLCHTKLGKVVYLTPRERGKAQKRLHRVCFEVEMDKRAGKL